MALFLAAVTVVVGLGAVAAWAVGRIVSALRDARDEMVRGRTLHVLGLLAPGVAAASDDSRALLTWQPLAVAARTLFPDEFAALDRAAGGPFPFNAEQIQEAHARWTAAWLAWELAHDSEYKLKAAVLDEELGPGGGSAAGRARLNALEHERLERYHRRYEDYARVSKALQALAGDRR